jgi:hypothetical protein
MTNDLTIKNYSKLHPNFMVGKFGGGERCLYLHKYGTSTQWPWNMKFTQFYTFIEAYMPYLASKPMFRNLFFSPQHTQI